MSVAALLLEARKASGLTQAELAERAGTSQPAVNRYERGAALPSLPTLERLVRATGRSLVVDTVPGSRPGLVSGRSGSGRVGEAIRAQRARILDLADAHGARNVRVFGSVARGEDDAASDVDFVVDLAPGLTLLDLVGLRLALEDLLEIGVDVTTFDMLKPAAREAVRREAVPL